ncbi:Dihydropteroate synthase [Olavius algarvensis spirochete endosymbiont]|uniref:dihydropteroate synthase n=1 Tax=Olavius algarvensis spirochete endosymbiont TaxID=260710 RepID=UPI00052CF7FD|nr:dihydropteroate synthase [Olavius algarvensis spirochete endosymbiont]KGM44143.1 hypothetical protein JY97_02620 [Alkalispirochaeta odontotermitis]CAD7839151.1 MAG: Dihydropteroate synthase (EC 2.5.1.15) [Olavius algarvensis spirochete endosymbiont]VDA99169.1 Dihydropteroate synthase [Olavius algarvensis spirochete endosymbiont]
MDDFRIPRIMGIINCTPDSFFAGSRSENTEMAFLNGISMIKEGAEILDIGGESSRPGSVEVDEDEQIRRVVPVIQRIREVSKIPVSIDTKSARVAERALDTGADIINDISALRYDMSMAALAAEREVPVVLMHMRGTPSTMQLHPRYHDPIREIRDALMRFADRAMDAGISKEDIILDPGIGFGKRLEDNLALISKIDQWRPEGFLIMVGLSRKTFLGQLIDSENQRSADYYMNLATNTEFGKSETRFEIAKSDPENRLIATCAANTWCIAKGVDILRVHDVGVARQLVAVWEAFSCAS